MVCELDLLSRDMLLLIAGVTTRAQRDNVTTTKLARLFGSPHSQSRSAASHASVRIKGSLENISLSGFGFDIRFMSSRLGGQRMSNPLH
jgi:hypothetical protein